MAAGQAIDAGSAPSSGGESGFSAKAEAVTSSLALELSAMHPLDIRIVSSTGEMMLYSRDQSEIPRFMKQILFRSFPSLVVQARSTEGVAAVLAFARAKGLPVIPRGSASSPFGGAVPVIGGIVIDVSPMDKVLSISTRDRTVSVQAGARWADIDRELEKVGLCLGTSPSSKFSTVGGWIATGGLGLNSYSRGHLRNSIRSVELVTSDGMVRTLVPGSDEYESVFGSEGQLGVITSATLLVKEVPKKSRPHLIYFDSCEKAFGFVKSLQDCRIRPAHVLYESSAKFSLVNESLGGGHFRVADAILLNVEDERTEDAVRGLMKTLGLAEENEYLARYLWNERFFPMKVRRHGPGMLGSEAVVPTDSLERATVEVKRLCAAMAIEPMFEIHFLEGGGSLFLCYYITDQGNTLRYTLDAAKSILIMSKLVEMGARPYSVGIWNSAFSDSEDPAKSGRLLKVKQSLDPHGIMNPGKYFSLSGRFWGVARFLFKPDTMRFAIKIFNIFSPVTYRVLRALDRLSRSMLDPKTRSVLLRTADECAMCGACVSVCPAYLIVGDERVTARGKLMTAKAMAGGASLSPEHAHRTFLCMRCKACEQVCQSKLDLIRAFDELESGLEMMHGRDAQEIERFVKYAENTPEYESLIQKGLVVGAPKHGMGGGASDV